MADKRVFISFAIEDRILRDFLVGQKRNDRIDIAFTDYSVKEPWDNAWKTNCRSRIKSCDGMIGIITKSTPAADGQLWELKCGLDEEVPTLLIHGYSNDQLTKTPDIIKGEVIKSWSVDNISQFIGCL